MSQSHQENKPNSTMSLADIACSQLPRELRDQVYSYLWDDDVIKEFNDLLPLLLSTDPQEFADTHDEYCRRRYGPDRYGPVCHLLLHPFIDAMKNSPQMCSEALEWLYENSMKIAVDDSDISAFLYKSIFDSGVYPSSLKLRGLTVKISMEKSWASVSFNSDALETLLSANRKPNFQLTLFITDDICLTHDALSNCVDKLLARLVETEEGWKILFSTELTIESEQYTASVPTLNGDTVSWRALVREICNTLQAKLGDDVIAAALADEMLAEEMGWE